MELPIFFQLERCKHFLINVRTILYKLCFPGYLIGGLKLINLVRQKESNDLFITFFNNWAVGWHVGWTHALRLMPWTHAWTHALESCPGLMPWNYAQIHIIFLKALGKGRIQPYLLDALETSNEIS